VDEALEVVLPPVPVPPVPDTVVLRLLLVPPVTAEEPAAPAPPDVADEALLLD
jgi:hypothetical protein